MLLQRAKEMRRNPTPYERKLWLALRAKRFEGAKFRQQQVIGRYIVDFACRMPTKLVVEVDGDSHAARPAYDQARDESLTSEGYCVLRFTNPEIGSNLEGVLIRISEALRAPSLPPLAAAPSLP